LFSSYHVTKYSTAYYQFLPHKLGIDFIYVCATNIYEVYEKLTIHKRVTLLCFLILTSCGLAEIYTPQGRLQASVIAL